MLVEWCPWGWVFAVIVREHLTLKGEEKNIRFDHQDRETSAKWLDLNIKLNNLLIAYLGTENIANARCLLYHLDNSVK